MLVWLFVEGISRICDRTIAVKMTNKLPEATANVIEAVYDYIFEEKKVSDDNGYIYK